MMVKEKSMENIANLLKSLNKKLSQTKNIEVKQKDINKLNNVLKKIKNWQFALIYDEENYTYRPKYISSMAKELMENFINIEAKHSYDKFDQGLKLTYLTHHSFCNVPVKAKPFRNTSYRTDKVLFYPAISLPTEREYTFVDIKDKKDKYHITILKIYKDLALNKILLYKKEEIEIKKDLVDIPKDIKQLDLKTIKAQAIAISNEETKNKVKPKDRTAKYKEHYPVDEFYILSDCSIKGTKEDLKAVIYNEETGEEEEYTNLYLKRDVAFTIFGIGYEKEAGWFPGSMIINVFKRKDILSKKSNKEEYLEKHTYHLNGKKLQVDYKSLYLKGIYGIDKTPSVWSYASITANNNKLNTTIPIPIQRKIYDKENKTYKWQRTKPSSIERAVYQILGTQKINYKGEEIYLPGKRMFIDKELIDIKDPSWLKEGLELIRETIKAYRIIQRIKNGIDFLEENVEDLSEIAENFKVINKKNEG